MKSSSNQDKRINFGNRPELYDGIEEVMNFLKQKNNGIGKVFKSDALQYLIDFWRKHEKGLNK